MLNLPHSVNDREPQLNSLSLGFIEELYASYLRDPKSVSADWRRYFQRLGGSNGGGHNGGGNGSAAELRLGPSFHPASVFNPPSRAQADGSASVRELEMALLQDRVDQLVRAYRVRGHMVANIDPLGMPRPHLPELDPEFYGFTDADMDRPFSTDTIRGPDVLTLRRHSGAAAQHLLPLDRRAVHAHRRSERAAMAARPDGRHREPAARSAATNSCAS